MADPPRQREVSPIPETLVSASVKSHAHYDPDLLFRAQVGGILLADWPTASFITSLIDTTAVGKVKIPDTYESVGQLSEDGVEFEEDISMVEIRGWGSISILRRDFESIDHSIHFSMIEERRIAFDAATGLNTKAIAMSAAGERAVVRPSRPSTRYRRLVALAQDWEGDQMVIKGKSYPKVTLTERGTETWQNGDEPVMREVTFGADDDASAGGPLTEFLLGPGAKAYAARMGITVLT